MHLSAHPPRQPWKPASKATGCRCCGHFPANRPRGLCYRCHRDPDTRAKFPPVSKYGVRGVGNGCKNPTAIPEPTPARPGTAEKVDVLAARVALGLSLWHDLDGRV